MNDTRELKTLEMTRQELIDSILETYANSFKADYEGEDNAEDMLNGLSDDELIKEFQDIELQYDMDCRYKVIIEEELNE